MLRKIRNWFKPKFRIYRCRNLGETWFEIEEWNWYWPFWDRVSVVVEGQSWIVKYDSLYAARQTILYRITRKDNLSEEIMEVH